MNDMHDEKIRALILSGANNHDWKRSSPFVKSLLESSGRFEADITEDPASALANAENLARYGLIFDDYNGDDWGEPARSNFLNAVKGGTGLVVLHAGNNAFVGWAEFEKAIGLQWGPTCTHTRYYEFPVTIRMKDHPITEGIGEFTIMDELYCLLENRQNSTFDVLATAYSDPNQRGTDRDEPVAITLTYGKGRVFQSMLGHIGREFSDTPLTPTYGNPNFQKLLLRGSMWASRLI